MQYLLIEHVVSSTLVCDFKHSEGLQRSPILTTAPAGNKSLNMKTIIYMWAPQSDVQHSFKGNSPASPP